MTNSEQEQAQEEDNPNPDVQPGMSWQEDGSQQGISGLPEPWDGMPGGTRPA